MKREAYYSIVGLSMHHWCPYPSKARTVVEEYNRSFLNTVNGKTKGHPEARFGLPVNDKSVSLGDKTDQAF